MSLEEREADLVRAVNQYQDACRRATNLRRWGLVALIGLGLSIVGAFAAPSPLHLMWAIQTTFITQHLLFEYARTLEKDAQIRLYEARIGKLHAMAYPWMEN